MGLNKTEIMKSPEWSLFKEIFPSASFKLELKNDT